MIRLAEKLSLPIDVATQTMLVVGKRGSGKSNTCVRLAEGLFRAGVPFVAIDPVDNWHGLKSSKDGKAAGLGVYVFGGSHADAPLEPAGGALMADVLVEHRISAVLSVKHFSGRERARFVSEFAERLFQKNRDPLHVFLEEAHEVAPQSPMKGEEEMVGRINRLVKLGRSSGVGVSAITQRPASLSKNVTTQAEILVVHRTIGPQDVAAVREWIRYHGDREDILGELATLHDGEAFVWAPDFPKGSPIGLRRVRMLMRETFDSAATPKAGERRSEPKAFAQVDLEALTKRMSATIERAKADDPRELRKQLAEAKRELAAAKSQKPDVERVEVPILDPKLVAEMREMVREAADVCEKLNQASALVAHVCTRHYTNKAAAVAGGGRAPESRPGKPSVAAAASPLPRSSRNGSHVESKLGAGECRCLAAVVQHMPRGVTRDQLTVLTGYKRATRDKYVYLLSQAGLVEVGETICASASGMSELGDVEPLPTGEALRAHWLERLPEGERRLLVEVVNAWPRSVHRDALTEATGYKRATRDKYLYLLATRKLVEAVGRGEVRASEALFG